MARDLDLDVIVQAVYDLLNADARTNGVNWEKGRYTSYGLRTFPGGGVSLAPGLAVEYRTIPGGIGGSVAVQIRFWTSKHEGITETEQSVQDYIGKVIDVLVDTPQLAVASYTTKPWLERVDVQQGDISTNIEATPPYAEAAVIPSYQVYKE
jgi:hypothetical protein